MVAERYVTCGCSVINPFCKLQSHEVLHGIEQRRRCDEELPFWQITGALWDDWVGEGACTEFSTVGRVSGVSTTVATAESQKPPAAHPDVGHNAVRSAPAEQNLIAAKSASLTPFPFHPYTMRT